MKVTALMAHPDDELMCAGTLARFVDEGHDVTLISCFLSMERTQERIDELAESVHQIGCECVPILSDDESDFVWSQKSVQWLEPIVGQPDLLIAHRVDDANTSHGHLGQVARTIARKNRMSLWEIDQTIPGGWTAHAQPNHFVNVEQQWQRKLLAVEAYQSQWAKYPGLAGAIKDRDRHYGWTIGSDAAEGFTIHRSIL